MKESEYRSYDDLPLFLNAATVAKVLGVSLSSGYELMLNQGSRSYGWAAAWWCQKKNSSCGWRNTQEAAHEV